MGDCNPWCIVYDVHVQPIEPNNQRIKVGRWNFFDLKCITCETRRLVRVDVVRVLDKKKSPWNCNSCTASENLTRLSTRHGKYGSGSYCSWRKMKDRCLNPNHVGSKHYFQRGIGICEKWMSFEGFYEDMGNRPNGWSLDRIDNYKGYFKENCRWIPLRDQSKNRRDSKKPYTPPPIPHEEEIEVQQTGNGTQEGGRG